MKIKAEAKVHLIRFQKKIKKQNLSSTAQNGGNEKVLKLKNITQCFQLWMLRVFSRNPQNIDSFSWNDSFYIVFLVYNECCSF